jgi:hypothetical protein
MQNFLKTVSAHWKKIITVAVITAVLSAVFGYFYNKTAFNNTIFITIAAGQASNLGQPSEPFETVQASDSFTETVMGWFKNPSFLEQVKSVSGQNVDFSVRKQEKQNLVVTFKTGTSEEGKRIGQITEEVLRGEIAKYNQATDSDFRMPVADIFSKEGTIHPALFAVAGLFFGLFLGYFLGAMLEIFLRELQQFRHGKPWI